LSGGAEKRRQDAGATMEFVASMRFWWIGLDCIRKSQAGCPRHDDRGVAPMGEIALIGRDIISFCSVIFRP